MLIFLKNICDHISKVYETKNTKVVLSVHLVQMNLQIHLNLILNLILNLSILPNYEEPYNPPMRHLANSYSQRLKFQGFYYYK